MAEYKQHISQREYNPDIRQSGFNPPAPDNNINSDYQRKARIAQEFINIGKTGAGAFGLAHQRREQQEELDIEAENKIDSENLIKAEVEGRTLAAGGREYNYSTAKDLINRSIKYRKNNPELVRKLNRGFKLKTGELTLVQFNSNVKTNAEVAVKQLGMEWIKEREEALLVRGRTSPIKDFPDFIAEYIDIESLRTKQLLIKDNDLIDEVLAQEGKRLNYEPVFTAASKWYKDYKDREKEKAINHSLSLHAWDQTNGEEYFKVIRPRIMKFNNIQTKERADLETVGYLQGELLNKIAKGSDNLINDPLFQTIPEILSYKNPNNVSLLDAGGKYSVGTKAKELLTLVNSTYKRLNDARDAISKEEKNKAEEERIKRLQYAFTQEFTNTQDRLRLAKNLNDIHVIKTNALKIINAPYKENITLYKTLGDGTPKELLKLIDVRAKELKAEEKEGQKPRVLTPDELKLKTDAEFKIGEIEKRVSEIQNYQEEDDLETVDGILKNLESIYEKVINDPGSPHSDGLGTDWKDWDNFYKLYNTAWGNVKKQKSELTNRIDEANKKSNLQFTSYAHYSRKAKNEAANARLEASIVDSMHDGLESFLKLPSEERLDFNLDIIERALEKKVKKFTITNDGLSLTEDEVPLFGGPKQDEYRRLIANHREIHAREVADKTKVSPIETTPVLYEEINKEIDALRGEPEYKLYSDRFAKEPGKLALLKKKLSEKLLSKELSTPHYTHFSSLLTKLSSNVDKTLDETYGSKSVYDKAYSSLRLTITGSQEEGIETILSESKSTLLNESTEDLMRFEETMVKRYPSIFSDTNMYNYDVRRGILSAYVEWLKGTKKTEDILQSYIGIRKYTGEEKSRFTDREIKIFEDSIPKDESPYRQRFEDLSIKIGGVGGLNLGTGDEGEENEGEQVLTTTNQSAKIMEEAARKGYILSEEELRNLKKGTMYTWEEVEAGDHATHQVLKEIVPVNKKSKLTDKEAEFSLGFE